MEVNSHQMHKVTCAEVKSNDERASLSLLCAQTQERPRPSHAADPATTSAEIKQKQINNENSSFQLSITKSSNPVDS